MESFYGECYNMENKIFDFWFEPVHAKQARPNYSVGNYQVGPVEFTRMVQLWKMWKDVNQLECVCCHEILAVKAFHLHFKVRLSWNTAVLDFFVVEFNCVGNNFLEQFFSEKS